VQPKLAENRRPPFPGLAAERISPQRRWASGFGERYAMSLVDDPVISSAETHLELALSAGRMGSWSYDLATGRQVWSPRQFELFGLPPGTEITRDLFISLVVPEDLPAVAFTEADLAPGTFRDCEFRIRRPDGEIRWLTARSFARHDANGKPVERIGVNWDITEQKQREVAQSRAERRLALATEAAQIGIWEWHVDTGAFYYSPRARSIYGFAPDQELTYALLRARTNPDDYVFIEPMLERALDPKLRSQETFRYRITRADNGEERWLLAHGGAVFTDNSDSAKATSYIGTLQDITDEVLLEQALEEDRVRLELALAAGELAIWQLDARSNAIVASRELNRLYRFADGATPKTEDYLNLYAPGEMARVQAEIAASMAQGDTAIRYEAKHQWPDGTVKWIAVRAQVMLDPRDRSPSRVIGVALDVTDRHLAEERMLTITRELQHRVKNSLTVVQAIATQSFRSASKEDGLAAFSGRLQALATATELVTRGNWVTVAIDDIVQEIVRPFRDEQSQRVTISGPPMLINSRDATSLGMALHELCTNAVKYGALSSERGSVSIDWSRDADGRLHLRWRERDGPPVSAAHGKGFGTRLLTAGLFDPGTGSVELRFEPDGVACDIHLVLGNVAAD
jgi:PAS domain S-box-containing protein